MSYTIIATEIPQISQAFTRIDGKTTNSTIYTPNNTEHPTFTPHKVEWVKPFDVRRDNEWELNVLANGRKVNVKAVGLDVFVNGEQITFEQVLNLKALVQRKAGL